MSRLQISDNFGGQQLQTHARPVAQVEQTARPVEDPRWKSLADAFAGGAGLADTMRQQQEEDDRDAAKKWAQSMTVSELGKQIEQGHMMPSQSPVFVGTVQHIWGVNSHEALARDVQSKLTTGELKFNSPQEANQYLTEARNTALAGQSEFAVAGFDKGFGNLRDRVMDGVSRINDKTIVDNAQVQATDFLANSLNKVTAPDFKGTPAEAASAVMSQYALLRHTKALPDAAAKAALGDVVTRMAGSGNGALLGAFLNSELEGGGSVRATLGESKALALANHASTVFDGKQRQRIDDEALPWYESASAGALDEGKFTAWATGDENKKYVSSATTHSILQANRAALAGQQRALEKSQIAGAVASSNAEAERRVVTALQSGSLWSVQGTQNPKVLTTTGDTKDFNVKDYAEQALVQMTANLPFDQQVSSWSLNGLDNPDWKNRLQAGFNNLATIGVDAKGKPVGQLSQQGKDSVELFRQLDATAPDYAKNLLGEKTYNRFSDIAFLQHYGKSLEEATALAANAASGAVVGSDTDKLVKKVHAGVSKLEDNPWYKPDWAMSMMGDNTQSNTVQLTGTVRRYATLLAHSGQYGDADSAIAQAAKYIADPKVTAKVNGTLYMRSEMPQGPKSMTQDEWFERYIDEAVKPFAKGLSANGRDVRMEYDSVTKAYRPYVAGLPMTDSDGTVMVVPKTKIEEWYRTTEETDVGKAVQRGKTAQFDKAYSAYRKRVWDTVTDAQQRGGTYALERYDKSYNGRKLDRQILGEDAFRRISADGNQDKSLHELMQLYP